MLVYIIVNLSMKLAHVLAAAAVLVLSSWLENRFVAAATLFVAAGPGSFSWSIQGHKRLVRGGIGA